MRSITTSLWTGTLSLSLQELSVQVTVEVARCAKVLLLPAHVHMHRKHSRDQSWTSQPRGFVVFALFETSARLPLRLPVKDLKDFVNISAPENIIYINTHTSRATWRHFTLVCGSNTFPSNEAKQRYFFLWKPQLSSTRTVCQSVTPINEVSLCGWWFVFPALKPDVPSADKKPHPPRTEDKGNRSRLPSASFTCHF